MKVKRFECCPCDVHGLTEKQIIKHTNSPRHELGLALEEIRRIKSVEERTETGPALETVNAETYIQRAINLLTPEGRMIQRSKNKCPRMETNMKFTLEQLEALYNAILESEGYNNGDTMENNAAITLHEEIELRKHTLNIDGVYEELKDMGFKAEGR